MNESWKKALVEAWQKKRKNYADKTSRFIEKLNKLKEESNRIYAKAKASDNNITRNFNLFIEENGKSYDKQSTCRDVLKKKEIDNKCFEIKKRQLEKIWNEIYAEFNVLLNKLKDKVDQLDQVDQVENLIEHQANVEKEVLRRTV